LSGLKTSHTPEKTVTVIDSLSDPESLGLTNTALSVEGFELLRYQAEIQARERALAVAALWEPHLHSLLHPALCVSKIEKIFADVSVRNIKLRVKHSFRLLSQLNSYEVKNLFILFIIHWYFRNRSWKNITASFLTGVRVYICTHLCLRLPAVVSSSVCVSVCLNCQTDFHEMWYCNAFLKCFDIFQFVLFIKSCKSEGKHLRKYTIIRSLIYPWHISVKPTHGFTCHS
jgi:hypothetical protein